MKRILLLLLMTLCLCLAVGFAMADVVFVSGDYTCTVGSSGMATITSYNPEAATPEVTIPSILNGSLVTAIGDNVFQDQTGIKTLVMPDNITSIGKSAFSGCTSLESVQISQRLTSLGMYAFSGCSSLESAALPDSVTSMGMGVFSGCTALVDVRLSAGLTAIPSSAFLNCSSLAFVEIPEGVSAIQTNAFAGCASLARIALPDAAVTIPSSAGLRDVLRICHANSENVLMVREFIDPTAPDWILAWDSIGNSVTASAYEGTSPFPVIPEEVSGIPVTGMKPDALLGKALASVELPADLVSIEDDAFLEVRTVKVIVPASCTHIGAHAFAENPYLIYVYLPNGLTDIADTAFDGCPHAILVTQTADSAIQAFAEYNGLGYLDLSAQ